MQRRLTAGFALGAFVLALLLPSVTASHTWGDADLAGTEVGLFSGHPTTQFEGARTPIGPEHCALCHWLRSLGSSIAARPQPAPSLAPSRPDRGAMTLSIAAVYGDGGPARAPPSARA